MSADLTGNDDDFDEVFSDSSSPIVVDHGSCTIKAGYANELSLRPQAEARSIVGRMRQSMSRSSISLSGLSISPEEDLFVGSAAQSRRGMLDTQRLFNEGRVMSWKNLEKIWRQMIWLTLNADPDEDLSVMLTEACISPRKQRERMTEIMFEAFEVKNFYLARQGTLSLFASGRTTGLCVDIGDGLTQITSVYEGHMIPNGYTWSPIAGNAITDTLYDLLRNKSSGDHVNASKDLTRQIKEYAACVRCADQKECENEHVPYEMPDGQILAVGDERFRCTEILFNPGSESGLPDSVLGVSDLVVRSLNGCSRDIHAELAKNLVLAGGSARLQGLGNRLKSSLEDRSRLKWRLVEFDDMEPRHAAWVGGKIVSSLSSFSEFWLTKEEYEDTDSSIVHRKCF